MDTAGFLAKINQTLTDISTNVGQAALDPVRATFVNGLLSQLVTTLGGMTELNDADVSKLRNLSYTLSERLNSTPMDAANRAALNDKIATMNGAIAWLMPDSSAAQPAAWLMKQQRGAA
jgi:hypothetical protein